MAGYFAVSFCCTGGAVYFAKQMHQTTIFSDLESQLSIERNTVNLITPTFLQTKIFDKQLVVHVGWIVYKMVCNVLYFF